MKKIIFPIIALLFLTACNSTPTAQTKPKIPSAKPTIPKLKTVADNLVNSADTAHAEGPDMERLVERINKSLTKPAVTSDDIERGWYYGDEDEKKFGTPSAWIWMDERARSRWTSPNAVEISEDIENDGLCRKTAGVYVISCIEREVKHCEYVPESTCRCSFDSKWVLGQGCIKIDENEELVSIAPDELAAGWYLGLPNEKKLDTPLNWVWVEKGRDSRWQNPSPY